VIGLNIYSASRDETLKVSCICLSSLLLFIHLFFSFFFFSLKVWNLETGKCIKTVKEHTDYVCSLAHYGNKLYSGGMDRIIKVYNLDTMECEQTLEGHTQNVSALVASSTTLYSGSWDKTIKIWQ
jgi:WD40 repeat protein